MQDVIINYLCVLCYKIETLDNIMEKGDRKEVQYIDENKMIMKKTILSIEPELAVCCICFTEIDIIKLNNKRLSCGHKFHEKCINN